MITRYRTLTLLTSRRLSRHVSTVPSAKHATGDQDASIIEWLTSPSSNPPPITNRFTITHKPPKILLQTPSTSITLTPSQTLSSIKTLLNPNLHRTPSTLPPLTIEYSSPNIAKPLHMGHLRSTITGSYVHNISRFAGHPTTSICFLGDWGRQFGILHAGILERIPDQSDFKSYVASLSLHELLQIYVTSTSKAETDTNFLSKAMQLSSELESQYGSDSNAMSLWTHTRTLTVNHLKSCYSSLGIHFDVFEGESSFKRDSKETQEALNLLDSFNLTTRYEDGSLRVKVGDTESILLKKDDSSVYLLRDIACALKRKQSYPGHKYVYVVDSGQSHHFKTLFNVLKDLGLSEDQESTPPFSNTFTHVQFGRVSGMSTRSGNFVLLSEVIDQGTNLMHESRKNSRNARNTHDRDTSEKLAISGLIINALKVRRTKTYAFDWNEALRSNGNSGVALQYTNARLKSLVRRVTGGDVVEERDDLRRIEKLLGCGKRGVVDLVTCVMNFEDTFWRSYTTLEPCILVSYAFNLSDKISTALTTLNVIKEQDKELADAALWLFCTSNVVLSKCLTILGVPEVGEF